jgi:lysyl-tRNA synthetase, class I
VSFWSDELAQSLSGRQLVNDSKTPSGPVHVGSLRGVLIHDAVFRSARDAGLTVRYSFGSDDFDPLDELPYENRDLYQPYLGAPLCNIPAPPDSPAADLASHYIADLFDRFPDLGVGAETYRMRDIYRSGRFDAEIDHILSHAETVRRVDREIANTNRADDWYPFQVICPRCGRIGTTKVFHYDGTLVSFKCLPDLVRWAKGCGAEGRISPFGGNGKLSWKLEWVAKWHNFGVTVEGAGKDHNTKGGSRDVAAHLLRALFKREPPANVPYEFFLVEGAKMSSSRGVGVSMSDMSKLLPPELLRFLMLRSRPNKPVDFSPNLQKLSRLFEDFDRLRSKAYEHPSSLEARIYEISMPHPPTAEAKHYWAPPFDLAVGLLQLPHLNPEAQLERVKGSPLEPIDVAPSKRRLQSAQYWLDRFATEEDRIRLQPELPAVATMLSASQRAFLWKLSLDLGRQKWDPEHIQGQVFNTARLVPLAQSLAFRAIYTVLLAKDSGPKAGNLLSFLSREFVVARFQEVPRPDVWEFWSDTTETAERTQAWLAQLDKPLSYLRARPLLFVRLSQFNPGETFMKGHGILELEVETPDQKRHLRRTEIVKLEGSTSLNKIYCGEDFWADSRDVIDAMAPMASITPEVDEPRIVLTDADAGGGLRFDLFD